MSLQDCHKLYDRLDKMVEFNSSTAKGVGRVTLNPLDYKIFVEYNSMRDDGTYHYRNLLVSQIRVKK